MKDSILLSIQENYKYILAASTIGEYQRIVDRRLVADTEYEVRPNLRMKDIIAYGKGTEVSEKNCIAYIPQENYEWGKGFRCYDRGKPMTSMIEYLKADIPQHWDGSHIHETAHGAWCCALQIIGSPDIAILYKVKITNNPIYYVSDHYRDTDVSS